MVVPALLTLLLPGFSSGSFVLDFFFLPGIAMCPGATIRGDTYYCVLIRKKPAVVAIKIGYNSVETVEGCILNGFQSISVKVEPTKN
jgi:hypothetical protein